MLYQNIKIASFDDARRLNSNNTFKKMFLAATLVAAL